MLSLLSMILDCCFKDIMAHAPPTVKAVFLICAEFLLDCAIALEAGDGSEYDAPDG
jgi:hypothetical protein